MPAERVLKKVRLQEHHVAPQASPTTTADTATVITAAEQGSTGRTAFTPPATITTSAPVSRLPRLGAQSNVLRGHYKQTDLKDPLVFFSEEIALHILELLTPSELARCACVSTQWYRLVNDQMLWRRLFYKDQFIYPRGLRNAGRIPNPALTGHFNNTITATTSQDRRNLKRKRTGPTHHQHQQHHRQRQDEHMVYGDPSSSSTSNSCWKALYRLNYNWIAGQAQVTSLSIQQLSHQDQLFFNLAGSSLDQDMEAGEVDGVPARTHSPIVQFQGPVLLIVSPGDMVHLWKIKSAMDVQEPGRDGPSSSPALPAPSESMRRPEFWQTYRSSRKTTGSSSISCLALDRSSAVGDTLTMTGWQKVMVGYDSGHFSIFEYLLHHQDDKPSELGHNKESTTTLREIGNTADLPAWSDVGGIQSASFLYPILTTCSDDGTISIYKIQEDHSYTLDHPDEPRHWCRLLHRLYGSSPLSPVEMELRPIVAQPPTTFEQDEPKDRTRPLWRALITFGLQLMDGSWTVRLQEIEFDEQFIWHSIETGVEDESDFERVASYQEGGGGGEEEDESYLRSGIPSSPADSFSNTRLDSAGHARIGTISAITISSPYVVTTHPDNTMNVFHMARPSANKAHKQAVGRGGAGGGGYIYPKPIRFRHLSTLYGHCGAVSSVAIESRSGRLVSASMDRSIKVWTMVGRNRYDQLEQRRVHQCALSMNDLPQSWTLGARVNKEEGLGLVWVGTDDEKIVSMNSDGTVKVWLFS